MKTWPSWREDNGLLSGFDLPAPLFVGPYLRVLRKVPGVTDVRRARLDGERVKFKFVGYDGAMVEPFGDNSRYWVYLKRDDASRRIDNWPIHQAFAEHHSIFDASTISNFIEATDTNIEFEYLVRPYLAHHLEIHREWTTIRSYWSGGRTILVCRADEERFVSVNLTNAQIGILSPSIDEDFEDFGRGLTPMQVAQEAFACFLKQLLEQDMVGGRGLTVA